MAADNTSGFKWRRAVAPGPPNWSMHAYGLGIDVNTVQNPYLEAGAAVQPPAGAAYRNRSAIRRGMAHPGGELVQAFTAIGWGWGGTLRSRKRGQSQLHPFFTSSCGMWQVGLFAGGLESK